MCIRDSQTCCSEKDIEDAAEVAFALDMPYQVLDFTADFRAQIIEKFIRVYEEMCIRDSNFFFPHLLTGFPPGRFTGGKIH